MDCADQDEVDDHSDELVKAGGEPAQCGWIKDPFGLSWQIVPRRFTELISDEDPGKVKAVMEAPTSRCGRPQNGPGKGSNGR